MTTSTLNWLFQGFKRTTLTFIVIITFTAPLLHIFQPTEQQQLAEVNSELRLLVKSNNDKVNNLFSYYENGKIDTETFIEKLLVNKETKKKETAIFYKEKAKIIDSIKYRGYDSKREFFFAIGLALFILLTQIRFMRKVVTDRDSSIYEKIEVYLYTSMAIFIFLWAAIHFRDFSNTTYIIYMVITAIIAVYFLHLFFKHQERVQKKLKSVIAMFSRLATIDAPKYMNRANHKDYKKHYIDSLKKNAKDFNHES